MSTMNIDTEDEEEIPDLVQAGTSFEPTEEVTTDTKSTRKVPITIVTGVCQKKSQSDLMCLTIV